MKLFHATTIALLTKYRPISDQVAHFFARINENDSIYFSSVFRAGEDDGIIVTRFVEQGVFRYFLQRTGTKTAYETLLTIVKQKTWSELMACSEWLSATHSIAFEAFPIKLTIIHSLGFTDTLEFNREPMCLNRKIYHGYDRWKNRSKIE